MMEGSHFEDKGQALLGRIGQTLSRVSMALIATVAAGFLVAGSSAPAAALVISDSGSGTNDTVVIDLVTDANNDGVADEVGETAMGHQEKASELKILARRLTNQIGDSVSLEDQEPSATSRVQ